MEKLSETIKKISGLSDEAMEKACERQKMLTKPEGSLGVLEEIAIKIAGITGVMRPKFANKAIAVFAADHGVTAEGVSAYPKEVTSQMVLNFLTGGAAINVIANQAGARVVVVDAGVASDLAPHPDLVIGKIGYGTKNIAEEKAMTTKEAIASVNLGISIVEREIKNGLDLLALGEMGIGNTTPSAAIASVIIGLNPSKITGKGTGITEKARFKKISIINKAIDFYKPDPSDGIDILSKIGGFEIGAIAGAILGAAAHRIPVIIDGFITTAAALIAKTLCPAAVPFIIASHVSSEIGHYAMLSYLKLTPLLDFRMRLGEGTGAGLAMTIVETACRLLDEMATFDEAKVSGKE